MSGSDRPRLHLTPPAGWMNDPNGLTFLDGRFHVFYQYEPDVPRWGRIRWGHAASRDLIGWEHLPIALEPDPDGPDALGCWSGCLVDDGDGRPTIFYTAVVRDRGIRRASIATATSDDGLTTWTKDPAGPVIGRPPPGIRPDRFRDPFVYRDGHGWAMLVGAGTNRARGTVLLYRSDDLRSWRYAGPFLTTEQVVAAQPSLDIDDIDGPCWECPQLVRLGAVDALVVSVVDRAPKIRPAHVLAFLGRIEGDRFLVDRTERLGLGPDFYAPATVTAPDGRRIIIGWIPEDPPTRRSSRTWAGSMTLPRVISLDEAGSLRVTLAAELDRFEGPAAEIPAATVSDATPWSHRFDDGHFEFRARIVPADAASIRLDVAGEGGTVAEIRFDPTERRLTVARTGRVLVAGRHPHGSAILPPTRDGSLELRVIVDGSTLELVADRRMTATVRLPEVGGGHRTIACSTIGGECRLIDVETSPLREPQPAGPTRSGQRPVANP